MEQKGETRDESPRASLERRRLMEVKGAFLFPDMIHISTSTPPPEIMLKALSASLKMRALTIPTS